MGMVLPSIFGDRIGMVFLTRNHVQKPINRAFEILVHIYRSYREYSSLFIRAQSCTTNRESRHFIEACFCSIALAFDKKTTKKK